MKRTPFYHQIAATGARIQPVQGWAMPDEFTNAREEHLAVRERVGLSDWASTGEIEIQGRDALSLLQRVIVNDATKMKIGRVLYSTMCKSNGAILSDITVYRFAEHRYWVMTAWGSNAANQFVEFDWLKEQAGDLDVSVTDVSSGAALLAVQGPRARNVVAQVTSADLSALPYMHFCEASIASAPRGVVSRTGYTGELGYELVVPAEYSGDLWDALIAAGRSAEMGLLGLKAAFGLRLEKGYIARFDFMDSVTPLEAGLGWTIKFDKGDFVGRAALAEQKRIGVARQLCALALDDDWIPATGNVVLKDDRVVGKVTSGGMGYAVGRPIGLCLVPREIAEPGIAVHVEAEGVRHAARIAPRAMYDPEGKRLRA